MNANELNKWIENSPYTEQEEVVILLRQLQAEIKALKAEVVAIEKNTDYWADKNSWIRNNEPVAWTNDYCLELLKAGHEANLWAKNEKDVDDIPLYTHPARLVDWSYQQGYQVGKETNPAKTLTGLTAEERKAIWVGILGHYSCPSVGDIFAEIEEAILRKASEK